MRTLRRIEWPAVLLLLLAGYQIIFGLGEYPSLWLKRAWKTRGLSGMERSALFFLGGTGSQFMDFIATHVPPDQAVVVPERSAAFSSQSPLSYYLAPRKIIACGCDSDGNKCFSCLAKGDHAVPVTRNFPPEDWQPGEKQYIPFDTVESDYYLGLYVSPGWQSQTEQAAGTTHLALALLLDTIVWAAWLVLGALGIRALTPQLTWAQTLASAIFLGMGLHTWVIFMSSWLGIPISIGSLFLSYLVLLAIACWVARKRFPQDWLALKRETQDRLGQIGQASLANQLLGTMVAILLAAITLIGIVRSYSTYDDIAIWSLKGHIIAQEGSILAARETSGHGLAYPLNISLMVAVFRLVDGDVLPGSKLVFALSLGVLAFNFYDFWRQWHVRRSTALAAVLLLLSIPVLFLHATLGFANLPFTAYLLSGVFWGLRGLHSHNRRTLLLSGLWFALAGWTRPEGVLFATLLMFAPGLHAFFSSGLSERFWSRMKAVKCRQILRREGCICCPEQVLRQAASIEKPKSLALLGYWSVPLLLPLIWLSFAANDIRHDQAGSALQETVAQLLGARFGLEAVSATLAFAWQQALHVPTWGIALPFATLAILLFSMRLRKISRSHANTLGRLVWMAGLCSAIPLGLFAIEATNESDFHTFLTVSFDRAFFPAALLFVLWAVLAIGVHFPPHENQHEAGRVC